MANTSVQLRAFNGQYVCAEGGGGREMVVNRGIPDVWETFSLIPIQGGALQDGSPVALQVFNGQYVCAEGGGGGIVVANRSHRYGWETFTLRRLIGSGQLRNGDQIGLQAPNGQYFCAEDGGGRELVANRDQLLGWETFAASVLAPRRVRVELDTVACADTEDVAGADEFYAAGAGADRFSGQSVACLSTPFAINNGQRRNFPAATTERVLFEGEVDAASTIVLGIKFFDEDSGKDWSRHGQTVSELQGSVSSALKLLGPKGTIAGGVLTVLTQGVGLILSLDRDDLLGDRTVELLVGRLPVGTSTHTIGVRGGSGWWSSWNYLVNLKVTVN